MTRSRTAAALSSPAPPSQESAAQESAAQESAAQESALSAAAPATPRTARLINDRLAFDLLLDRGPLTRAQLRNLTGLSGPTVSDLVHRLEAAGLVAPVGEAGTERRGPNATLYGVVAERAHVAGVEVRSDSVVAILTDATGRLVGEAAVCQDPAIAPDRIVGAALDGALVDAGLLDDQLRMVVVGTPGLVDPATGDLSFVATLPTWHANVLPGLRRRYGDRVLVENEVNLAALAEHRLGAARGRDTFALLWLDVGIGAAIVLNGELLRGASGGAGELAYLPGAGGSFQYTAGGAAVSDLAATYLPDRPGEPHGQGERDGTASPGALVAAAVGPDAMPGSAAFLDAVADRVAAGAAAICAVLDPGYLVLAGEVGRAGGDQLANRVAERLADAVPLPTQVVAATVGGPPAPEPAAGPDAGARVADSPVLRGAVLVALDRVHRDTFTR
ncbi:ROK family transcriptional regulator [Actinopolymorpha sp. B17G11]|uniref:ROK family transcriptional regulator n=1 Tax=Actinopolymorpha sp. B17G11 TaxID=3160861 RepID=UPI0032E405D1